MKELIKRLNKKTLPLIFLEKARETKEGYIGPRYLEYYNAAMLAGLDEQDYPQSFYGTGLSLTPTRKSDRRKMLILIGRLRRDGLIGVLKDDLDYSFDHDFCHRDYYRA